MKVLNLYACLGGNRLLWKDCKVTAVELDPDLARMYQERFPNDNVIVGDAHQYLLNHYKEFDFIWSSPPCPTHSRARFWGSKGGMCEPKFPDMMLYEEIIFLQNWFDGKWLVENVIPYYTPLIPAKKIGRHMFWSNFLIPEFESKDANINEGTNKSWLKFHNINKFDYTGPQRKDKLLRNLVHYETGLHIFNLAKGIHKSNKSNQQTLEL